MFNKLYQILLAYYPMQKWWPGTDGLEIAVGTILTQNTSWNSVEKSISALKKAGKMELLAILDLSDDELAELIRPSGFAMLKSRRLKNLLNFIRENYGAVESMRSVSQEKLRKELLLVNGVGRETADSILLYALEKTSFVIDAYTRRILGRHGIMDENLPYDELKAAFEDSLPRDVQIYAHFHAMIVEVCKEFCVKRKPRCESCPLRVLNRPKDGV